MVDGLQLLVVANVQQLPELAVNFRALIWGDEVLFFVVKGVDYLLSTGANMFGGSAPSFL